MKNLLWLLPLALILSFALVACGDDDDGSEADRAGVGAECVTSEDCAEDGQTCLTTFSGGYCGVQDCAVDDDCPAGSSCVIHDDGVNYCFLNCVDKVDCNTHRSGDNEANCSASITYVDEANAGKACVPPSGS